MYVNNVLKYDSGDSCCADCPSGRSLDAAQPGMIMSPGYPYQYPANQDCYWDISAEEEHVVILKFIQFWTDREDYVEVRTN